MWGLSGSLPYLQEATGRFFYYQTKKERCLQYRDSVFFFSNEQRRKTFLHRQKTERSITEQVIGLLGILFTSKRKGSGGVDKCDLIEIEIEEKKSADSEQERASSHGFLLR